jgi:hypothetical protein
VTAPDDDVTGPDDDVTGLDDAVPHVAAPDGGVPERRERVRAEPVAPGPMARAGELGRPSMMVGLTNWLVARATGVLEKRTSRRGFLVGSAMVGSAVAVSGCMVATQPGTPYNHITDCAGGLCTDGYTEFCCVINDGLNACPSDSFAGGWWRADDSRWCADPFTGQPGRRYYIDCMQYCFGPKTGYQNFCAGTQECRCAAGCDTRKVYCNYFRYGQCHQELTDTGPIACRVVTCVPPYQNDEWACSTADAVDDSTSDHHTACLSTLPAAPVLPSLGAVVDVGGRVFGVAVRTGPGNVNVHLFNSAVWLDGVQVLSGIDSGLASATDSTGAYVFGRGFGTALYSNRLVNGVWQGQQTIGGVGLTADPVAVKVSDTRIQVFVRSQDNQVFTGRIDNGAWQGWRSLGGFATSNLAATANPQGVFLFARGWDGALWWLRVGAPTETWQSLGGQISSDPTACSDGGSVYVFARSSGRGVVYKRFDGSTWSVWQYLGGSVLGDPKAFMSLYGPQVLARDDAGQPWNNGVAFGSGTDWKIMWNPDTTGVNPLGTINATGITVFMVGRGGVLYRGTTNGPFSGWAQLGTGYVPVTAA